MARGVTDPDHPLAALKRSGAINAREGEAGEGLRDAIERSQPAASSNRGQSLSPAYRGEPLAAAVDQLDWLERLHARLISHGQQHQKIVQR
jgi:hypothetical protein